MKELILIAIGAALVNNVVLSQFLGICAFLGVSKKMDTAAGMGGAVIFVLTISSFVTSLIYKFILDSRSYAVFPLVICIVSNYVMNKINIYIRPQSLNCVVG